MNNLPIKQHSHRFFDPECGLCVQFDEARKKQGTLIATVTDTPDGTKVEMTDYGRALFGQFSDGFIYRANVQFDEIREQHRQRLEAENAQERKPYPL